MAVIPQEIKILADNDGTSSVNPCGSVCYLAEHSQELHFLGNICQSSGLRIIYLESNISYSHCLLRLRNYKKGQHMKYSC